MTVPLLEIRDAHVVYGGATQALRGMSLTVPTGGCVAVLGPNGAGKSTTARLVTGLLRACGGRLTAGSVELDGVPIGGRDAVDLVRCGVSQVMEGRRVFADLSVEHNLRAGGHIRCPRPEMRSRLDEMYALFPSLARRRRVAAGNLSGGEQQMLAIGRALMQRPRLLVLDEPTLGLAPSIVEQVQNVIASIHVGGVGVLLIEQNVRTALALAQWAYVVEGGVVAWSGNRDALRANDELSALYLGGAVQETDTAMIERIRTASR